MQLKGKEKVLKNIRHALMSATEQPFSNVDTAQPVFAPPDESLDIVFAHEFSAINGQFVYCEDEKELIANLNQLAEQRKWKNIFVWEYAIIQKLQERVQAPLNIGRNLEKADAGLTSCEALIARTGSILITSRTESGRALSIFPPVHLVLAYANQLVYDLRDAYQLVMNRYGHQPPSMISIITGPSRTADIEKTLVLGAHGPKELWVLFVDQPKG
ncbi:MAG: lactate utilization protein [Chitinophagales bacterium]|nr:lactate utilization protein [Chitinophagales bacterium]MDW8428573.1 lactate utilization protein [Chitinophagales bacterium]